MQVIISPKIKQLTTDLEPTKAEKLIVKFQPHFETLQELKDKAAGINVESAEDTAGIYAARQLRLQIKNIRTTAEADRKEAKKMSLIEGKAIDGLGNLIKLDAMEIEKRLKDMEELPARIEAQRREELKNKRGEELAQYGVDPSLYPLDIMPEEGFNQLLENSKLAYHVKKEEEARIQAEREEKARKEAAKIAEQAKENARLKARAKRVDAVLLLGMQKNESGFNYQKVVISNENIDNLSGAKFQELIANCKSDIEQVKAKEAKEAKAAKAAQAKLKRHADAKQKALDAERKKVEKLKAEAKRKEDAAKAEAKRRADQEERERKAAEEKEKARKQAELLKALAPDKVKLEALCTTIRGLEFPQVSTDQAKSIVDRCEVFRTRWLEGITKAISEL